MSRIINTTEYNNFIHQIKSKIRSTQIKASIKVNVEMLKLYWDIAKDIVEKQKSAKWGDGLIKQISKDLKDAFPNLKGFSVRNIKYMRQWFQFYTIGQQPVAQLEEDEKSPQPVRQLGQQSVALIFQIPWGHNIVIISQAKNTREALFYINQTIENNWSRAVLVHQIESDLYRRKGKAITNFQTTLPKPQSDLANQFLKDPYTFDFLTIEEKARERELEQGLLLHLRDFLIELGRGFAFVGNQYHIVVGSKDYYIDLLFYNVHLHCYVVIELKMDEFKPEYAGKMNFYLSAVDDLIASEPDSASIGIVLCKTRDKVTVEYALRDTRKPMGVAAYRLTKSLPGKLRNELPSIKELEKELGNTSKRG